MKEVDICMRILRLVLVNQIKTRIGLESTGPARLSLVHRGARSFSEVG